MTAAQAMVDGKPRANLMV